MGHRVCIGARDSKDELADDFHQVLDTNEAPAGAVLKNIESARELMKALAGDLQAEKGLAGSLLKDQQTEAGFSRLLSNLTLLSSNSNRHMLLWKPRKSDVRPPSPLYPGRDPRH